MSSSVGERLRDLRVAAGLSQIQLAGDDLSPSYISLIEAGKRQPSGEVVHVLAQRLGCTTAQIIDGQPPERQRRIELELKYARLALAHGESDDARERLVVLLGEPDLDAVAADQARYYLALAHEKTNDLESAVRVALPLYERSKAGACALPPSTVGLLLCHCYRLSGDLNAAVRVGLEGITAAAELGLAATDEHFRLAATVVATYTELGDTTHATIWAEQLIEAARRAGSVTGEASLYWNAALAADAQGRTDQALVLSERALARLSEQGGTRDLALLRNDAAWLLLRADPSRAAEAVDLLDRALPDLTDLGSPADLAYWESTRSHAELLIGRPVAAEDLARKALLRLNPDPSPERARVLTLLGDAALAQHRPDDAREHFSAALGALAGVEASRFTAAVARDIADRLAHSDPASAAAAYRTALDMAGTRGTGGAITPVAQRHQPTGVEPAALG